MTETDLQSTEDKRERKKRIKKERVVKRREEKESRGVYERRFLYLLLDQYRQIDSSLQMFKSILNNDIK